MCLCLARYGCNGCIIEDDIKEAITSVTRLVYASRKASEGQGLDPLAQQTKRVVDYLIGADNNQLTRTELLTRGYGNYDSMTLDRILETLMEMKWVKRTRIGVGKNMDYMIHLSGEPLHSLLRFREEKQRNGLQNHGHIPSVNQG
jgi:hypothetical protein